MSNEPRPLTGYPACPKCSAKYAARVRREGIKERLLSLIYVYPFRCQLCGWRFKFRQWGVRYFRMDEDRRTYQRLPARLPLEFSSDEVEGKGWVADIAMSGCAITADKQLSQGKIVSLSLWIGHNDPPVVVAAIVRNIDVHRVGFEFLMFQKSDRERLQGFLRGLLFARSTAEIASSMSPAATSALSEPSSGSVPNH